MPHRELNFNERGLLYKMDYYFQIILALFIFVFVTNQILELFMPGFTGQLVNEWSQIGNIFTYSYDAAKKFLYFLFKLPEMVAAPILA